MKGDLLKVKQDILFSEGTVVNFRTTTQYEWLQHDDFVLVIEDSEILDEHYRNFIVLCKFGIGRTSRYSKYYEKAL
jgi:hypothetical protein